MRKWNLLVIGDKNGLVGAIDDMHPAAPKHYERVPVVEISELISRLEKAIDRD